MNKLSFADILPRLEAQYRLGLLVPFTGSGVSRPTCTNWEAFVNGLTSAAGVGPKSGKAPVKTDKQALPRLAEMAVNALRSRPIDEQSQAYRQALLNPEFKAPNAELITPALRALTRIEWPLVVTTNYDDLFCAAAQPKLRVNETTMVLGRSLEDAHRVLRSLDETKLPILWAVQGFLGGQVDSPETYGGDERHRQVLARQIVVGHRQYQQAINADGHFRRAFAEVFRRRSLMFVGSGILETYFENLFGEIIHHHGIGPHPHFALLNVKDRNKYDPAFLQTRLGIVPVFIDVNDLPGYLDQLADQILPSKMEGRKAQPRDTVVPVTVGFTLAAKSAQPVRFSASNTAVPDRDLVAGACLLLSVGRDADNNPLAGNQVRSVLDVLLRQRSIGKSIKPWKALDKEPSLVYRCGENDIPIFLIAARDRTVKVRHHDQRSMEIIPEAVYSALKQIDRTKNFTHVHMGAVASGKLSLGHPIHAFALTLQGIQRFVGQTKSKCHIQAITLHLVDRAVWSPIIAGKIPVLGLLTSELLTYRVELRDAHGDVESFAVTLNAAPTLGQLMEHCRLSLEDWHAELVPQPFENATEPTAMTRLASTMTLMLSPRKTRP
jgi:SIR2-like domain